MIEYDTETSTLQSLALGVVFSQLRSKDFFILSGREYAALFHAVDLTKQAEWYCGLFSEVDIADIRNKDEVVLVYRPTFFATATGIGAMKEQCIGRPIEDAP